MEPDFVLNQLGIATGSMAVEKSLAPVVIKATLKAAPAVAKAGVFSALNIGITAAKIGINVANNTQNLKTIQNPNLPISKYKPILERINDWFRSLNGSGTIPVGSGSHQRVGIVYDGNDGTTDNYTDKADNVVDNIHLGPIFFNIMKMYKPSVSEGAITNQTIKNVVNSADAVSNVGERVYESVHERNETKVTRGSGGRQVSKTVQVLKYQIGPNGDTVGNSIEPVTVPLKQGK